MEATGARFLAGTKRRANRPFVDGNMLARSSKSGTWTLRQQNSTDVSICLVASSRLQALNCVVLSVEHWHPAASLSKRNLDRMSHRSLNYAGLLYHKSQTDWKLEVNLHLHIADHLQRTFCL